MFCTKCGTENVHDAQFCKNCGSPLAEEHSWAPDETYTAAREQPSDDQNEPLSIGQFVLYLFLFGLPVAGLILMIFYAFGKTKKTNLKNFARGCFISCAVAVVLTALICLQ